MGESAVGEAGSLDALCLEVVVVVGGWGGGLALAACVTQARKAQESDLSRRSWSGLPDLNNRVEAALAAWQHRWCEPAGYNL